MNTDLQEVEFAGRLTLKDLGLDGQTVKKLVLGLAEGTTKVPVARFYGTVSRVAIQNDKMGTGQTYTQFIGNFEGVNLVTGEVVQSARMYLPDGASQALENQVSELQSKNKTAITQFAFEIRAVKASTKQGMGYAYETAAILKPTQADPISAMRQAVSAATAPKAGADAPKGDTGKGEAVKGGKPAEVKKPTAA
jgi:hypothetical protein